MNRQRLVLLIGWPVITNGMSHKGGSLACPLEINALFTAHGIVRGNMGYCEIGLILIHLDGFYNNL